MYMIYI